MSNREYLGLIQPAGKPFLENVICGGGLLPFFLDAAMFAPHPEALAGLNQAKKLDAAGGEAGCMSEIAKVKALLGM